MSKSKEYFTNLREQEQIGALEVERSSGTTQYIDSEEFLRRVEFFMSEMKNQGQIQECISVSNIKLIIKDLSKHRLMLKVR